MRPAGMVRHAECRHFDGTDLDAVEVLLRGRNGLAIMQPQREIAVCPLVEFSRQILDALRESPWVPPERDVPIYLYGRGGSRAADRSDEHPSELQSLIRISYAVSCLKKIIIYIT